MAVTGLSAACLRSISGRLMLTGQLGLNSSKISASVIREAPAGRHAHIFKPAQPTVSHAFASVGSSQGINHAVAGQENQGNRNGSGKDGEANLDGVSLGDAGAFNHYRHDRHDQKSLRPRVRDQNTENQGQGKDRKNNAGIRADKAFNKAIGQALTQAGILNRAGNQISADYQPHGGRTVSGSKDQIGRSHAEND